MEAVMLDCGHVQLAGGGCATIGCRNEQSPTSRYLRMSQPRDDDEPFGVTARLPSYVVVTDPVRAIVGASEAMRLFAEKWQVTIDNRVQWWVEPEGWAFSEQR